MQNMFEKGDEVYLVSNALGASMEKLTVDRVTSTMAFVSHGGQERKFDRATGYQKPRPSGFSLSYRIEARGEAADQKYRKYLRRILAGKLAFAATQYERGDEAQEARIVDIYADWRAQFEQ